MVALVWMPCTHKSSAVPLDVRWNVNWGMLEDISLFKHF